jgi:hypothetical protein
MTSSTTNTHSEKTLGRQPDEGSTSTAEPAQIGKVRKLVTRLDAAGVSDDEIIEALVRTAVDVVLARGLEFKCGCHFFDAVQVLLRASFDFTGYAPPGGHEPFVGARWRAMVDREGD